MDKEFHQNADTLITERHGNVLHRFRTENERNVAFLKVITAEFEAIKSLLSPDIWPRVEKYIDLLGLHSIVMSKYAYVQGIKDCARLAYYVDNELIDADFNELVFDDIERRCS